MKPIYLLDNNVLIFLQWGDPHFDFGGIYDWVDTMAQSGRVYIPEVVLSEFKNKERKQWFDDRPHLCLLHDDDQDECLEVLVNELPEFLDTTKTTVEGDQPLVAAAMSINRANSGSYATGQAVVVSHEQRRKPKYPFLKVPDACDYFNIRCISFFEMLRMEGVLTV